MNLGIRQFQNELINMINDNPLPIEVKRLVVKDILSQIKTEADKLVTAELEAEKKAYENVKAEEGMTKGI